MNLLDILLEYADMCLEDAQRHPNVNRAAERRERLKLLLEQNLMYSEDLLNAIEPCVDHEGRLVHVKYVPMDFEVRGGIRR